MLLKGDFLPSSPPPQADVNKAHKTDGMVEQQGVNVGDGGGGGGGKISKH